MLNGCPMWINMSAATSSATCMTAGTLLHKGVDRHVSTAPPSPIGFEATMSVAMELESTLKAESSDQYSPQQSPVGKDSREYTEGRCSSGMSDGKELTTNVRHVGNGHVSSKSLNENEPLIPTNGNGHHVDANLRPNQDKLDILNDSSDIMVDGDLIDDDDDSINGHSSGSEGHCSYGDISVDTSKEDDMDDDLDAMHKLQSSFERNGLHPGGGNGLNGRPDSSEGDYYEGGCNDSSQLTSLGYQHHGQAYQCHLCSFSSPSKFHFNSHLNTHYDHKCGLCDYRSRTEGRLKRHLKDFHADLAPEIVSEKGGKLKGDGNGQSKTPKTYRCKQCSYVATIKSEFWAHSKSHIKAEKLLTCPRCPFVTEYKHHLEYHLRNHFGSKPFRCPKCSYSCVNKSMLNSHMKSHSNVYQYRCADCTYATKYCHSLKLHLRKYTHTPSTVLNLDGTPNPMPIIDVYGTRRGPRVKKTQADLYTNDSNPGSNGNVSGPLLPFSPTQVPVNGSGISSATLPFFYAGDSTGPQPNGFHSSPEGLLQHSGNISKSLPHVNNHIKDEPTENGRQMNNGGGGSASFKCNLCDFSTDHNEMFSKHMLLHAAAENQDLCNLYGINSESLLQDPNQQPHSQMNVATMAAVAAALGFGGHHPVPLLFHNHRGAGGGGGGNNGLHRQVSSAQHSPQQQGTSPSSQGSQESGSNTELHTSPVATHGGHKPVSKSQNEDGGNSGGREAGPTNTSGSPHPLEHLRAFSEHVNIQPFTMRDYSAQLFPSDAPVPHLNVQTSGPIQTDDGHRIANMESISTAEKFAHSPNGMQAKYSPPSQQPNAKKAKTSSAKSPKRENVGGFGPLDLSSAKPPPRHAQYLNVHQLHHHQSAFQHFSMQQLQRNQQLSMAALQQHRFAQQQQQLQISTLSQEFAEGASFEGGCQLSPSAHGQQFQEGSQQQKHRRKGKAFKLDRICMKLQKEKGNSSPNGHQSGFNVDEAEESGDETSKEDCNKSADEDSGHEQQQDIGTSKSSPPMVAAVPCPTSPKPSKVTSSPSSGQNKVSKTKEGADCKNGGSKEDRTEDGCGDTGWKEAYQCQYCDMAFKDCIMYTVHMGYHGFKDPFKCNMCGQQTNDKVAFFLHIARTAHL